MFWIPDVLVRGRFFRFLSRPFVQGSPPFILASSDKNGRDPPSPKHPSPLALLWQVGRMFNSIFMVEEETSPEKWNNLARITQLWGIGPVLFLQHQATYLTRVLPLFPCFLPALGLHETGCHICELSVNGADASRPAHSENCLASAQQPSDLPLGGPAHSCRVHHPLHHSSYSSRTFFSSLLLFILNLLP